MRKKYADELLNSVETGYDEISAEFDQSRAHPWYEFEIYKELIKRGDQVKPKKPPYCNYPDWSVRWVYTDGKLLITRGQDRWVTIVDKEDVSL